MRLLLPVLLLLLASCSHIKRLDWKQESFSGTLMVPKGWERKIPDGPAQSQRLFQRHGNFDASSPTITMDVSSRFDQHFPKNAEGCALSYLDGIHDVHDDSVRFTKVGIIMNPEFGQVALYHYHSRWYGNHLLSFLVSSDSFIQLELWAKTMKEMKANQPSFELFVQGVEIKRR
jgi:hypothetical protein